MRFPYDKSSKWLIQHHGDSILRLAGVQEVGSWRPLPAEVVQARQLPDGLLEVQAAAEGTKDLFLLELATYADRRVMDQIIRDAMLVFLDRGTLPEAIVVVLRPKGHVQVANHAELQSRRGLTRGHWHWRVVELWTLSAAELLAAADPGLAPWVSLTHFDGPPEPVLQQCRAIINQKAKPGEHDNLLAVTQVLARLRYNKETLRAIFGGDSPMIESPLIQEIVAETESKISVQTTHKNMLRVLGKRFGAVPADVAAALQAIDDALRLDGLLDLAVTCADLEAFRARLSP